MKIRIIDLMDSYYDNAIRPDMTHRPRDVHAAIAKKDPAHQRRQRPLMIAAALILVVVVGYFSISLSTIWQPTASAEETASDRAANNTMSSPLPQQGILYD